MSPLPGRATARFGALLGTLLVLVSVAVLGPSTLSRAASSGPASAPVTTTLGAPASYAGTSTGLSEAVTTPAVAAPADASHPYTDPVWFPLRSPAHVGCVLNNCPGPYHGYWAIDFGGNLDDPIYAAGGGIFHIGAINNTCPKTGNTSGTWVWIDHGPAGITLYEHLNRVLAKEGQVVTPATEIGTMGHNGNTAPCHPNYLHMEWRAERMGGVRQPIPTMHACEGGSMVSFPTALGYSSWNSMPNNAVTTPTLDNDCMPTDSWGTPDRPTVHLARGSKSLVVTPSAAPAGADAWKDRVELYATSLHKYVLVGYHSHAATVTSARVTGLLNGRTYRVTAAFHDSAGWSAWASLQTIVPGSLPSVPVARSLTRGTNWITYSWNRSSSSAGTARYQVARRCLLAGQWHSWVFTTVSGTRTSYTWKPVVRHTVCEVQVRAHNAVGWSAFGKAHFTTTR